MENYPGFPSGHLHGYIRSTVAENRVSTYLEPLHEHPHSVTSRVDELDAAAGGEFWTKIVTDDVVEINLSKAPYKSKTLEGQTHKAHTVIIATGAQADYLGLPSEERYKNRGVARAQCATVHCRGFAISRWWWWAAVIRRWRRRHI